MLKGRDIEWEKFHFNYLLFLLKQKSIFAFAKLSLFRVCWLPTIWKEWPLAYIGLAYICFKIAKYSYHFNHKRCCCDITKQFECRGRRFGIEYYCSKPFTNREICFILIKYHEISMTERHFILIIWRTKPIDIWYWSPKRYLKRVKYIPFEVAWSRWRKKG